MCRMAHFRQTYIGVRCGNGRSNIGHACPVFDHGRRAAIPRKIAFTRAAARASCDLPLFMPAEFYNFLI
jgi:hypothetical protein